MPPSLPPPGRDATLIPASKLSKRLGVHPRTLLRWRRDERMGFPRPLVINRLCYWRRWELEDWEAAQTQQDDPAHPLPPAAQKSLDAAKHRKTPAPAEATAPKPKGPSQDAVMRELALHFGGRLRWDKRLGAWRLNDGAKWRTQDRSTVAAFIREAARRVTGSRARSWPGSAAFVESVERAARSDPAFATLKEVVQ